MRSGATIGALLFAASAGTISCGPDWDALDPSMAPIGQGGSGASGGSAGGDAGGGAAGSGGAGGGDLGSACENDGDCATGPCEDDVCCASTCDGECRRCDTPGAEGTCQDVPALVDDPDSCRNDETCDDNGMCKLKPGEDCNGDGNCASNDCTAGTCE